VFTSLDVRSGFWHIALDEPSSFLSHLSYTIWTIQMAEDAIRNMFSARDIPTPDA